MDRATLKDWTYALSHIVCQILLSAFVGFTLYIAVLQQRDTCRLLPPDTVKVTK
jgi:hypothetical protein